MTNKNLSIRETIFQTLSKLDESKKIENEYKRDANIILNQQKLSKIDSFTDYFDFLHNNFQTPVYFSGILYPSVSHAYHAARSNDERTRRAILNAETFQSLGNIALRINDPIDWQEKKVKIMEQLVRDKFRRSKELQERLKLTEGRDLVMTYNDNNSKNIFWGVVKGNGQNQLGRILMKIREDLLNDKIPTANPLEILNWVNTSFNLVNDIQLIPEIKLTVNKLNKTIDHIVLKGKSLYKIGQFPECDLVVLHPSISRLHAIILIEEVLGVILIDLHSKGGTKIDNELIKDNIPYRLKTGKKINFAMSTRDYIIEIDISKVKRIYEREQMKLREEMLIANQLNNKNKEIIEKSFGIKERKNEDNDTIFVKNIPFSASKEKLIELFEKNFGKIIDVYWPKEQDSGFRMNYAFIQFDSTKSAKKAVEYGIISYEEEDDETEFLDGNKEKRNYPLRISYSTNRKMINNSHRKSHLNKNKFRKYKINYKDKNFKKRDRSRKKNLDDNSKSSSSLSDSFDKKKKEKSSSSSSFNSESD